MGFLDGSLECDSALPLNKSRPRYKNASLDIFEFSTLFVELQDALGDEICTELDTSVLLEALREDTFDPGKN